MINDTDWKTKQPTDEDLFAYQTVISNRHLDASEC